MIVDFSDLTKQVTIIYVHFFLESLVSCWLLVLAIPTLYNDNTV